MKIIICLKESIDPALSLDSGLRHPVLFREGLPHRLDPGAAASLAAALELKSADNGIDVEIGVVSIGPERVETYLRNGLALGAVAAVRIAEDFPDELSVAWKSRLLAAHAAISGADLLFTGARSADSGNGQVGNLAAAALGWPCVSEAVGLEIDDGANTLTVTRDIGRGEREIVSCPYPAVITNTGANDLPYASLEDLLESRLKEIPVISHVDLGVPAESPGDEPVRSTGPVFPRPRPQKAPPLDSSLPAFYRILQLLEGGISHRRGQKLEGTPEEIAARLYDILLEHGVLQPPAD